MRKFLDGNFYDDNILEFGEKFTIFSRKALTVNEYGEHVIKYEKNTIIGSLQPQSISKDHEGLSSSIDQVYNFYCKSTYRVYVDDIILTDKNEWLLVYEYTPWDNFGVRSVKLRATSLSQLRNLEEFQEYLSTIETPVTPSTTTTPVTETDKLTKLLNELPLNLIIELSKYINTLMTKKIEESGG